MKRWSFGVVAGATGVFALFGLAIADTVANGPSARTAAALLALGIVGTLTYYTELQRKELNDQLIRRQSQVDLLQVQLDQQQTAVDLLADGLDVALFICDARGGILYANRRAVEMFNAIGPSGRSILAATLSPALEKLVIHAAVNQEYESAELTFNHPVERVGLVKAWPHHLAERVFLSIYEITELRRLERIRQDFVANVSHEIRTPLTIIRGMAETLLDSPEDFPRKGEDYLNRIVAEADRLSLISNDLLILSVSESHIVRRHDSDVAKIFRSVVQGLMPKAREKGLTLSYVGPDALGIEANETQITQVAMNLIENALNYTTHGGVTVELSNSATEVTVSVHDTGIGIASDQISRIFERFYRIDRARSRSTGGTGLGLSIVKHIVEAHGGGVGVESSFNSGSVFTIRLPVGDVEA